MTWLRILIGLPMNRYDVYLSLFAVAVLAAFASLAITGGIYHDEGWGIALLVIGGLGFTIVGCIAFCFWFYMTCGFKI